MSLQEGPHWGVTLSQDWKDIREQAMWLKEKRFKDNVSVAIYIN